MKNIVREVRTTVLVCSVAVLTACGGGGGGGDATTPSSLNFSLLSAWQDHTKKSLSQNFTITGDCSGSGSNIVTPIRPASGLTKSLSGQGTPISYLETGTLSAFYSNCSGSGSEDRVTYYDSNYHPIQVEFATEYADGANFSQLFIVYRYTASILSSVRANDAITIGSVDVIQKSCYSTCFLTERNTKVGGGDLSVIVRPESAESVLVDFVINLAINGQTQKNTETYRLSSTGSLTPVRVVMDYPTSQEIWTF